MQKVLIASVRQSAGKTSLIVGMARVLEGKFGYMKPFGERVLYRKKRLLDYDSALIKNIFNLEESPEDMSIGFDHSKLRFMYNEDSIKKKLMEMEQGIGKGKEVLLIESGKDLMYGASVNLDAFSIARATKARLVLVISGDDDTIIDDLTYLKNRTNMTGIDLAGVVINKVKDLEDFRDNYLGKISEMGVEVLGILPFEKELTYLSVEQISDVLFAKVLAGEKGLKNQVKDIFIGAMAGDAAVKNPLFAREKKLLITSGDREDMCIAALESDTSAIILTNNLIPPSTIIATAERKNIPLLLVTNDTFSAAKMVDDMERLLTKNDTNKIALLERHVRENIDMKKLLG